MFRNDIADAPRIRRVEAAACCLFERGGEAGKHFVHDVLRDGVDVPPVPGAEVEGARLVATDHAGGSAARVLE